MYLYDIEHVCGKSKDSKNLDKVRTIHNQIIVTTYWGNNKYLGEIELTFANIFGITVGSGVQSCWFKHGSKMFAEGI